ncbi:Fructosamine kinase-domain-containing protein [Apodospora peruviana]|uniref:protein-ribulosamine 3-kinase n=1 Tax=Apodospora peruviana TaxID=516989 RepID=A0AAE0HUG2_9PEZI|nr:Fructosamine kinase-domain-containing protein [Apodospora peruviana]
MVWVDPTLTAATFAEDEQYEGVEIDANVSAILPEGIKIKWVSTFFRSFWAINSKIDTILPNNGQQKAYFLKVYTVPGAADIARGEFESTSALANVIPNNVTRPIGHGLCASDPDRAFFLAEFRAMTDKLPASDGELVSVVAKIHEHRSPNGKFGFPVTTFTGKQPIDTTWCDTWEEYFGRIMKTTMEMELAVHGPHVELEALSETVLTKVIPRLIRPMETGGNQIEPVLLHGDLWHGNVSVDNETGGAVFYDPSCFYGHHEYDFSAWRAERYLTNRDQVRTYFEIAKMSEPVTEQDDRHALYSLRNDLSTSIGWTANGKVLRELAIKEMRRLVEKYGEGYEGYYYAAGENSDGLYDSDSGISLGAQDV